MKQILSILCLGIIMISCNGEKKKQQQELKQIYDQVIDIHDVAMPKLQPIVKYQAEIQKQLANGQDSLDKPTLDELNKMNINLLKSERAMMDWMHNLNTQYDTLSFEDAKQYLLEEKENITQVNEMMDRAVEHARTKLQ
ncbi:hypothetical protein [Persicobacter psychrovividus]|uniref:Viral A-type inclusion protein n=1 Tax=Persicobacter psychrovividus TaxID=387638 RepID=A0ABM7VFG7_9BACT|nr:hypothetical protein PEPS_19440 [Persicobacter psychrovividus]